MRSRPTSTLCLLLSLLVATGCSGLTSPAREHSLAKEPRIYWFDYAAERRGAILVPANATGVKICAEPAPDVALAQTTDIMAKGSGQGGISAETELKFATEVVQLAGRTQTVLFLREAMYRLCEQSLNGNLTQEQVGSLYRIVLETAAGMAAATAARDIADAEEALGKLKELKSMADRSRLDKAAGVN